MTNKPCGIITHEGNGELWWLCQEKLKSLQFTHERGSVPKHAIIIDIDNRTAKDCWLHGGYPNSNDHIDYGDVQWINVADFLFWDSLLTEVGALRAFAEMYASGRHDDFVNMLSIDFQYTSQWVFDSLTTRYDYEKYIREKLRSLHQAGYSFDAQFGSWGKRPCMALTQKSEGERQDVTSFATVLGGMITSVSIGMTPRPNEVIFDPD